MRAAYLLGAGLVTCLGTGLRAQVPALRHTRAPAPRSAHETRDSPWPYHAIGGATSGDRVHGFLDEAVRHALLEAGLGAAERRRMAVFIGSSCLDLPHHERRFAEATAQGRIDLPIRGPGYGAVAADLAARFGIEGPQYTLSTACSSSANALLHARRLLAAGLADHALVVGVEAFNQLSVQGFGSLLLLSQEEYRPFDRRRTGLILGEGAGAMVLGRAPLEANVMPFALAGGASACDTSGATTSRPDRVASVMAGALDDAALRAEQLCALKAHGTATTSNDLVEGQAMRMALAQPPPFTSLKPYVGHTLGACGVIESLLLLAAWREGFLPATPGFADPDADVGVEPVTTPQPLPAYGAVLCNFFGFGGNNTSLVFTREAYLARPL
jgi:3-oxoacyl-[acyl-carrier-protein] synthase-1